MSKLKTFIPIDVRSIINQLPPRSFIHGISFRVESEMTGKTSIPVGLEIIWDNDQIHTGRTYPVDYPLEKLGDKEVLANAPKVGKKKSRA